MRIFDAGSSNGEQAVSNRILTLPNAISLARILALPIIWLDLVHGRLVRALVLVAVFSATDWFDGYLARRLDQVSRLGEVLDPTADRLLFVVVGVAVVVAGIVPLWAVLVVVVRDVALLIIGGALLMGPGRPPPVTRLGKVATFVLMVAFPLFVGAAALGTVAEPSGPLRATAWATFAVGATLYWIAAIDYARILIAGRART